MFNNNFIGFILLALSIVSIYGFIIWWNLKLKDLSFNLGINRISKTIQVVAIIVLISTLFYMDFIRDYVFHNLTYRMNYLDLIEHGGSPDKYEDYTDSLMLKILGNSNSIKIYYLKYAMSVVFVLTYYLLSFFVLKVIYPSKNAFPFITLFYGLGSLAALFVFSGYFFTWPHDTKINFYLISMEIGHFLESSLPTLLSILGFKIYLSYQMSNSSE